MNSRTPSPESLLAEYAERIDAGDFDGVGQLFAHGEITDASGARIAAGADQVAALYRATTRRYDDGTPRTAHVTTNAIVELGDGGTTATVRSCFVVFQQVGDGPLGPIAAGRYRDRLELADGRWRFTTRQMVPEMFGDVSRHLLFDVAALTDPGDPA